MMLRFCSLTALLFAATAPAGLAADETALEAWLGRSIIGPDLALTEVQAYTESRVPAMPMIQTAEDWGGFADRLRRAVLERVVFRGEAAAWRDAPAAVEWTGEIDGGSGYRIRKLRYEALPGLWVPALLYEPAALSGKVPVILNVNGHDGKGKAAPYKQIRCINQAKRGMLALNVEWLGMGQLQGDGYRHYRMNQLDLCGTSGLAPFYLAMQRGLDILLSHEHADPDRVAVTGLSGGGWQTIFISSLDTRVKLCNPVAGYSSFRTRARHFSDLGDSEQTPCDLATVADYLHLTAIMAPRPTLLTYNAKDDCCFQSDHALPPLLEAAQPVFRLYGHEERLRWHVNHEPGTHNFERENREALYRMLGDHFYAASDQFDPSEISCDDELKTREQLDVELPTPNADFHTLALELSTPLPRSPDLPSEHVAAEQWQATRRGELSELVRAKRYTIAAERDGDEEQDGLRASFWRLRAGEIWTVPAVEIEREAAGRPGGAEAARETVLLVADDGRRSLADEAGRHLDAGRRVVALDPFYLGESKIAQRDWLFALMVGTIGDRPVGIQASQLAAVARWLQAERSTGPVRIVASGPRSSIAALVAAALETGAVAGVELHGSLGSLKEVIEENWSVEQKPELFCFGLLEKFDVLQIGALVAPRPVRVCDASERSRTELAPLAAWYTTLGSPFRPLE